MSYLMIGCCRAAAVEYLGGTGSVSGRASVSQLLFGMPEWVSLRIASAFMQFKTHTLVLSHHLHYPFYLPLCFTYPIKTVERANIFVYKVYSWFKKWMLFPLCTFKKSVHPPLDWTRLWVANTDAISTWVETKIAGWLNLHCYDLLKELNWRDQNCDGSALD